MAACTLTTRVSCSLLGFLQVREKLGKWKVVREVKEKSQRKTPKSVREISSFEVCSSLCQSTKKKHRFINIRFWGLFCYVPLLRSEIECWLNCHKSNCAVFIFGQGHKYFQNLILQFVWSAIGQSIRCEWVQPLYFGPVFLYIVVITQWKLYLN